MPQLFTPHDGPVSSPLAYFVGRLWLLFTGWKVEGQVPPGRKCILIAAPHTSNWDFPFMLTATYALGFKISWMGKDSLFKKPFGGIMRWLGGISIDRSAPHGVVDQMVEKFNQIEKLAVVISPSATRKKIEYWKSGFYWIALKAKIQLVCGFLDFEQKTAGMGLAFIPTGDIKSDMDRIRIFYAGIQGKFPEKTSLIRLKNEDRVE
ncbi:MAG: lysophospholipid acyltransferase family protein [Candidatus Marinimicrobia bacterium]|nr:lysophospholipid acyltransferase family protein [Candidatus Neomarinimicrobiota bacterium]